MKSTKGEMSLSPSTARSPRAVEPDLHIDVNRDCATCYICNQQPEDPRVLRCLHTFCFACIMTNCTTPAVRCPRCAFVTTAPTLEQLPKNYAAVDFLRRRRGAKSCQNCEEQRAAAYCMQCSCGLCGDCAQSIHKNAIFKSHTVVPLSLSQWKNEKALRGETSPSRGGHLTGDGDELVPGGEFVPGAPELRVCCSKHPQDQLTLFCRTCKFSICKLCALDVHRAHKIANCSDEIPLVKSAIPGLKQEMSRVFLKCSEVLTRVATAKGEVEDQYQRSINAVEDKLAKYMQLLQSRRLTLLNSLQDEFTIKMRLLDAQEATLRDAMANSTQSVCIANSLFPPQANNINDKDQEDGSSSVDEDGGSEQRLRLPSNRTVSVVCDIGASIPEYISYSSTQRLDTMACVDTNISVSFSRHEETLQSTVMSLGDILVLRSRGRMFPYSGDPFANDGIMAYYGCDRGIKIYQNPVHRGLVRLVASGVGYGRLENFVSSERSEFCTTEPASAEGRSWVTVILEAPVILSHYRLGHDTFDEGGHFLRSWRILGRNTLNSDGCAAENSLSTPSSAEGGGGWICLDEKVNNSSLNAKSLLCVFETHPSVREQRITCNEIRVEQTGVNSERTGHLMVTAVEFYGELLGK